MSHGPLMACGHSAQGTTSGTTLAPIDPPIPVCVICSCSDVAPTAPDLTGRTARCSYRTRRDGKPCTSEVPSDPRAAFFTHRPDRDQDEFYCGCWGWD